MRNFDCLDPSQNVFSPHFLEASAGTGKTFAINHIVVRLILDIKQNISIDEVLILTFTRAATRELRERIHSTLEEALEILQKKEKGKYPYLDDVLSQGKESQYLAFIKIKESLLRFSECKIFTIHSFCAQCLNQYGHLSSEGVADGEGEESAYTAIVAAEVRNFFRADLNEDAISLGQMQRLLAFSLNDIDKLVLKITSLILKPLHIDPIPDISELTQVAMQSLEETVFQERAQGISCECFEKIATYYKGMCSRSGELHDPIKDQLQKIWEIISRRSFLASDLDYFISQKDNVLFKLDIENCKKNKYDEVKNLAGFSLLESFKKAVSHVVKTSSNVPSLWLKVASLCRERVSLSLQLKGVVPPDEYIVKVAKALKSKPFKEALQADYKAAIIDEFQDTDYLQWEIFRILFKEDRSHFPLILVGDPKQSIYGFRSADLPTYLDAKSSFSKETVCFLGTNYRSSPKLIAALNHLFSDNVALSWLSDDHSISYDKVKSAPSFDLEEINDGKSSVHFVYSEEEKGRGSIWPSIKTQTQELYPIIAEEIASLKGLGVSDFAILVKDRFQAQRVYDYLKDVGIFAQVKSVKHIGETKAFGFFLTLMEVFKTGCFEKRVKELLAHPFFCLDDKYFSGEECESFVEHCQLEFHKLRASLEEEGFAKTVCALESAKFLETSTFLETLISGCSLQDYEDYAQVIELMMSFDEKHHKSAEHLFTMLQNVSDKLIEESDLYRQRQSGKDAPVKIMTTHVSKGLEFDVVFALGVGSRFSVKEDVVVVQNKQQSSLEVFDSEKEAHKNKLRLSVQEKLRLFYVAMTRAKRRVYAFLCTQNNGDFNGESFSPTEIFFHSVSKTLGDGSLQKEQVTNIFKKLSQHGVSFEIARPKNLSYPSTLGNALSKLSFSEFERTFDEKYITSYSSLAEKKEKKPFSPSVKVAEDQLPAGAATGSLLHAIIEKQLIYGLLEDKDMNKVSELVSDEIFGHGTLKNYEEKVRDIVFKIGSFLLDDGNRVFSLKDVSKQDIFPELEFLMQASNTYDIKGFIDLLFVYNGMYYLLDWKSNYLGETEQDYGSKELEAAMKENNYYLQASLYSESLKRYLTSIGEDFDQKFGGVFYVFLRAIDSKSTQGVYFFKPHDVENVFKEGLCS